MLKKLEISGFKSFAKKTTLSFDTPITAIVGPNGSGKSNVVEAIRFVLGEQSMKSLRGKGGKDLIWKGSKLLGSLSKGRVAITFDNAKRKFSFGSASGTTADLSYDEVTLAREITSDGGSSYSINGTTVRLKDISELLGSVNIGASGHHIISQGEADRLLSASPKDLRAMVEEALGLKVYQSRIKESERKLEKTAQNMKEVQALRRELAPHLTFLSKQVEKLEKAEELRKEFRELFLGYVEKESSSILLGTSVLSKEEEEVQKELSSIEKITVVASESPFTGRKKELQSAISEKDSIRNSLVRTREELGRMIGRIEGKLDALSLVQETRNEDAVPHMKVKSLCDDILSMLSQAEKVEDLALVKSSLLSMREKVSSFLNGISGNTTKQETSSSKEEILSEKRSLEEKLSGIDGDIEKVRGEGEMLRRELSDIENKEREAERDSYKGEARRVLLEGRLREFSIRREGLERREAVLKNEIQEAEALSSARFPVSSAPLETDTPALQVEREEMHKRLERIKIKLEDVGGASGAEILKEYEETKDRDAFLLRELGDIEQGMASLRDLIAELRDTIERTFKEGVEKINTEFGEFFKLMFGGGSAFLSIVVEHKRMREDEPVEEDGLPFEHGIVISVSLPHKKVRDLHMLSGGERSLVSIALLFAMSQVNPPPFLVLDETDAALDEANSRKYGDMLELLSKHSNLVVVTHNRETMSRAQVLYGVTMGLDGASKLLSIKFDEAVKIAK